MKNIWQITLLLVLFLTSCSPTQAKEPTTEITAIWMWRPGVFSNLPNSCEDIPNANRVHYFLDVPKIEINGDSVRIELPEHYISKNSVDNPFGNFLEVQKVKASITVSSTRHCRFALESGEFHLKVK